MVQRIPSFYSWAAPHKCPSFRIVGGRFPAQDTAGESEGGAIHRNFWKFDWQMADAEQPSSVHRHHLARASPKHLNGTEFQKREND